ncbi:hypothetical protein Gogos_016048 [Gossypium gossypioides]|uniref:DUF4283 domain-containing protein n=1 Tax=Gossypium gossypioides TaxID=34282 RepID=A0A7J9B887_GOSGO|nr:hypothetical protein [Gossypium gossypioides]
MDEELANLSLLDEEEEMIQGEIVVNNQRFQFCLVGRCLTDSVVHFPSLSNTMADLWHPIGGICITDLGNKRYLFQFFNEVDIQRVISGTPWFFNSHLLLLQRIQLGENLLSSVITAKNSVLVLNSTEFWVQIHDLPAGLMSKSMAKQFGDFLGKFLDYDASIPFLSQARHMNIRVRLDVTASLKRKKKIKMGEAMPVYARFKYENFGWDLSLRAVPRRRNTVESRWLREADGSQYCADIMGSTNQRNSFNCEIDSGRIIGRDFRKQMSNPNLIPLGSNQQYFINGNNNGRNLGNSTLNVDRLANGPIEMAVEEKNDPIVAMEGKKRQRIVAGPLVSLGINAEYGYHDLTTSSGEQSSRAQ